MFNFGPIFLTEQIGEWGGVRRYVHPPVNGEITYKRNDNLLVRCRKWCRLCLKGLLSLCFLNNKLQLHTERCLTSTNTRDFRHFKGGSLLQWPRLLSSLWQIFDTALPRTPRVQRRTRRRLKKRWWDSTMSDISRFRRHPNNKEKQILSIRRSRSWVWLTFSWTEKVGLTGKWKIELKVTTSLLASSGRPSPSCGCALSYRG